MYINGYLVNDKTKLQSHVVKIDVDKNFDIIRLNLLLLSICTDILLEVEQAYVVLFYF